jgi:hypothetical protein
VRNGRHTWKWFVNSPNASHSTCALTAIISTLNASISPLLAVCVLGSVRVWVSIHAWIWATRVCACCGGGCVGGGLVGGRGRRDG